MNRTVWEPLSRLLDEPFLRGGEARATLVMPLDVFEADDTLFVQASVSGASKDKIQVSYDNQMLTIRAEVPRPDMPENAKVWASERPYGQVARRLRLPYPVDVEAASAAYADGTLTLRLPKSEAVKTRTIQVQ